MKKNKGVLLIDFDGTVVEHKFPKIGKPLPQAFEVLKELQKEGWKLILWTCRENVGYLINKQFLKDAVDFCKDNGLEFDEINSPLLDFDFRSGYDCLMRKPHASFVIDDSNIGGFPGWDIVREILINRKQVTWQLN